MKISAAHVLLGVTAGALLVAFVIALHYVPRVFPPDPSLPSAAAMLGYNIPLAYWVFAGIMGAGGLMIALFGRPYRAAAEPARRRQPYNSETLLWLERAGILAAVAVLYWPGALARFGPHIEADYFINVLWRMTCGQAPYTDFEFLYGPLMIGLAEAWIAVNGYSMQSYYTFYFVLQLLFAATLILVLQTYIRTPWKRYGAMLLLLPFFFDTLLGLNWMAWRYFFAPLAILAAAARPLSTGRALLAGALVGTQLALSHEYGIAAAFAVGAIHAVHVFYPVRRIALACLAVMAVTGIGFWAVLAWLSTGSGFGDYLSMMSAVSVRSGQLGLGQFAFYWTVHSAALFVVLCCVLAMFSGSLRQIGKKPLAVGDLHLIGASVFLAVAMRVAMQRVGFHHMAVPFLPLILMLLLNQPRSLLWQSMPLRRIALTAAVAAAITHAAAHSFQGRWKVQNQARGLVHEILGTPTSGPIASRGQSILPERYEGDPPVAAVAARLAEPDMKDRPVLFYMSAWDWPAKTGVCPSGYSFYDLLYANDRYPHQQLLADRPDLAIAMYRRDYDDLIHDRLPPAEKRTFTDYRSILAWLSSPHYPQSSFENRVEHQMWADSIGNVDRERFQPAYENERAVILVQKP